MWQLLTGFAAGVYVGTYYDCKPTIILVEKMLKEKFPKERLEGASKNDSKKEKKDNYPPNSWF